MRLLRHTQACLDAAQRWPPEGRSWSGGGRARLRSILVFESTFVDRFFAQALPISPIFWVGPVFIVTTVQVARAPGPHWLVLSLFALGWLAWSFLEYLLHRFVFHMGARTPKERLRAFLLHGYHHQFPPAPIRFLPPP